MKGTYLCKALVFTEGQPEVQFLTSTRFSIKGSGELFPALVEAAARLLVGDAHHGEGGALPRLLRPQAQLVAGHGQVGGGAEAHGPLPGLGGGGLGLLEGDGQEPLGRLVIV